MSVVLRAPAKVNLHLGVYPCLDEQGYHRVDSLMVALDVADEVVVSERADGAPLVVRCEPSIDLPQEKNTAYRAAVALAESVGRSACVDVLLRKRLPSQAGLGGASSDAASTLLGLCTLWSIDSRDSDVAEVARSVGADVAFFLDPVPTLLVGRGDVVAEKFPQFTYRVPVVLARPAGDGVSTPVAYRAFDQQHEDPAEAEELCALLRSGRAEPAQVARLLSNNLDPVACRLLPQVDRTKTWLLEQDEVLGGQVCGSGSTVFGICATAEDARKVAARAASCLGPGAWTAATSFC